MSKARLFKITVTVLIVVLIVSVLYLVKYQSDSDHEKEKYSRPPWAWAPILNVGDSWKLALTIEESEYNLTITVTGEETVQNVSCYKVKLTFEPENPYETRMSSEMTAWLDKSTLNLVRLEGTGRAQGHDFIYTESHSYTFEKGSPSMTVGNEYDQIDTKTIDIDVKVGLIWMDYRDNRSTTTTRMKVEAVENVTVPAGTFSCYEIVTYDETQQNLLSTRWFSMEAKTVVKSENYETGEKSKLLSYSM